jgi:carbon monoxide dehydrogenase subunit G
MPGAALDTVDGDEFTGSVKVRLGPIGITYKGKARFVEKDEAAHRAVIDAQGKDARGNGTASATVTATLHPQDDGTRVEVNTDLAITGKPAQFGRGVMVDVGNKLIGQFADCLAGKLAKADGPAAAAPVAASAVSAPPPAASQPDRPQTSPEAPAEEVTIDLMARPGRRAQAPRTGSAAPGRARSGDRPSAPPVSRHQCWRSVHICGSSHGICIQKESGPTLRGRRWSAATVSAWITEHRRTRPRRQRGF